MRCRIGERASALWAHGRPADRDQSPVQLVYIDQVRFDDERAFGLVAGAIDQCPTLIGRACDDRRGEVVAPVALKIEKHDAPVGQPIGAQDGTLRTSADVGAHRVASGAPENAARRTCEGGGRSAGRWRRADLGLIAQHTL